MASPKPGKYDIRKCIKAKIEHLSWYRDQIRGERAYDASILDELIETLKDDFDTKMVLRCIQHQQSSTWCSNCTRIIIRNTARTIKLLYEAEVEDKEGYSRELHREYNERYYK